MKLIFNGMDELRAFLAEVDGDGSDDAAETATGTKRRTRKTKAEKEAEAAAAAAQPNATIPGPGATQFGTQAGAAAGFQPPPTAGQGFAPPAGAAGQQAPFGAPAVSPLVKAFIDKTEASVQAGQPLEAAEGWWRQFIGPDAAQANWDQIKSVHLPRVPEANLKAIAGQFGIAA
jgi:hypothetical protein